MSSNNPLGSTSVSDMFLNAGNLDKALNGNQDSWIDRFGVERVSWNYIEKVTKTGELSKQAREALRRSYAEAGLNMVDGSFEKGGILVNTNDVLLHEATGKCYSGNAGTVAPGTLPTSGGFVDKSDILSHGDSVSDILELPIIKLGQKFKTTHYKRPCVCDWEVVSAEENGPGKYSIQHSTGLWLAFRPSGFVTPAMVGAENGTVDNTQAILKAFTFQEVALDSLYGISGQIPIRVLPGQVFKSSNGPLTGSAIKAGLITLSPMDPVVDLSGAKYADLSKLIIDGGGIGQRGFKATNVFGLNMELCRSFNFTVSCYEFINDGTEIGSYINSLTKCFASNSPGGFITSSSGSESNLFVYSQCVATDCSEFGFREFGDNTGRDNSYIDCDAERCGIGMLLRSKNFSVVNPYIEFCGKGIVIDATGLGSGIQSGTINSPSILGKFNFPGVPSETSTGIELIGYCRNIVINNPWVTYHNTAIIVASAVTGLTISDPFIENCGNKYSILTKSYRITNGNKTSNNVQSNANNATIAGDDNFIFCDINNNARTWKIDTSTWLIGQQLEIIVMGNDGGTGALTISGPDNAPVNFFGQNKNVRVGGSNNIIIGPKTFLKLIKKDTDVIYFVATSTG